MTKRSSALLTPQGLPLGGQTPEPSLSLQPWLRAWAPDTLGQELDFPFSRPSTPQPCPELSIAGLMDQPADGASGEPSWNVSQPRLDSNPCEKQPKEFKSLMLPGIRCACQPKALPYHKWVSLGATKKAAQQGGACLGKQAQGPMCRQAGGHKQARGQPHPRTDLQVSQGYRARPSKQITVTT